MKEYEYIVIGIDEFLVDELVSVICQESYGGRHYPHGFRRIFDNFQALRENYYADKESLENGDPEEAVARLVRMCEKKRDGIKQKFLDFFKLNCEEIDVEGLEKEYTASLQGYDTVSTEKRVLFYPYLVKKIREGQANE